MGAPASGRCPHLLSHSHNSGPFALRNRGTDLTTRDGPAAQGILAVSDFESSCWFVASLPKPMPRATRHLVSVTADETGDLGSPIG